MCVLVQVSPVPVAVSFLSLVGGAVVDHVKQDCAYTEFSAALSCSAH